MPIYEFHCKRCEATQEKLRSFDTRDDTLLCQNCSGITKRVQVTRFGVTGGKPKTSDASLASTGADFASSPDKFVKALDTFGEKMGTRLTNSDMERAVSRLEEASK